jgi:predicted GH43/DUF377 family glycosyl hydrolase
MNRTEPIVIGHTEQLLLDDFMVEDHFNLRRRLHQPIKHPTNPIMAGDQPWEDGVYMPNVHHDSSSGRFQMWYSMWDESAYRSAGLPNFDPKAHGHSYFTAYADSDNGFVWNKPRFDGNFYRQWQHTNIVLRGQRAAEGTCILRLPGSIATKHRFVAVYTDYGNQQRSGYEAYANISLSYSDDGIHWTTEKENPVIIGSRDNYHSLVYDEESRRFLLFGRVATWAAVDGRDPEVRKRNPKRRFAVSFSEDLKSWSYPRACLIPDESDLPDIDQLQVVKYGSHFLGFVSRMDVANMASNEVHLVFSQDGVRWQKLPGNQAFLPRGCPGAWDAGQVSPPANLLRVGDWLYLYYGGTLAPQRAYDNVSAIGMARLKPGRFIGREAGDEKGYLLTREFVLPGDHLFLNCVTYQEAGVPGLGEIRVEILKRPDEPSIHVQATAIQGFSFNECDPICMHLERVPVTFKGSPDLSKLRGRRVSLRFCIQRAILYSFIFTELGA